MSQWSVTCVADLPLDDSDSWDGGAAEAAIFEYAGGDDFDPAKAKRGFCFQDSSEPKKRGSYKDPYVKIVGGTMKASKGGVDACVRRIQDTQGPSADQKDSALATMKGYQSKFGEGDDKKNALESLWLPGEEHVMATTASSRSLAASDDLMDLARARAEDGAFDGEVHPYFFSAIASNQNLDSFGTKMHDSSLRNYAQDAQDGLSFQQSHNTRELSLGQSLTGHYYDGRSAGGKRVEETFYTVPGLKLGTVDTDNFIRGMKYGIVRDTSIGFYGGTWECSVCGKDPFFDWSCDHIPFWGPAENASPDENGEMPFIWVKDAHQSELSAVYNGATPGAAILKARREISLGRMRPEAVMALEQRFRMKLPEPPARQFRGVSVPRGGQTMPNERADAAEPDADDAADNSKMGHGAVTGTHTHEHSRYNGPGSGATHTAEHSHSNDANHDHHAAAPADAGTNAMHLHEEEVRSAVAQAGGDGSLAPLQAIRALGEELGRLRPLADDGRAYRADLIEEALAEGVRSNGSDFKQETYREQMAAMPIAMIKQMRDDWKRTADTYFQGNGTLRGGRLTDLGRGEEQKRDSRLPDRAYAG